MHGQAPDGNLRGTTQAERINRGDLQLIKIPFYLLIAVTPIMNFNLINFTESFAALIPAGTSYGNSNIGVILDKDKISVIDSGSSPRLAKSAIKELVDATDKKISQMVLTSSRVTHAGGSQQFKDCSIYASQLTSDMLELPPNLEVMSQLIPANKKDYGKSRFQPRQVTHVISETTDLGNNLHVEVKIGDTPENILIKTSQSNQAEVIYLGSMASFNTTPLGFEANFFKWLGTLTELLDSSTNMIVPGHGMPGSKFELQQQANYLSACLKADGQIENLKTGAWQDWQNPEFHKINVERAFQCKKGNFNELPASFLELLS